MDFWNSLLTEKSWDLLCELKKKYDFVLIGGWAIYIWTKQHKSKDIDIVIDLKELQKLKQENISKNDNLLKYELKFGEIDLDIYVEHYSKLVIPVKDIRRYSLKTEGFEVICPEALLILKQAAELSRKNSVKGEKDRIDIMSLLFFSEIDFKKYFAILKNYSLESYIHDLILLIREFENYNSLFSNPREFKLKKKETLDKLRKI